MNEKVIKYLLEFQAQIKVMHWMTSSYAEHKAFDDLYEELDSLFDELAEVCMGKKGRPVFSELELTVQYYNLSIFAIKTSKFIEDLSVELEGMGSEVQNIFDEIKASLDKLRYLLTLK